MTAERDVAVGAAAVAARVALLPIRVLARSPVIGAKLAAAGRQTEAGVSREVDGALKRPLPGAVTRALASAELDARVADALRAALQSPEVRAVLRDETVHAGDDLVASVRRAALVADRRLERRSSPESVLYGGPATRAVAFFLDLGVAAIALAIAGGLLGLASALVGTLRPTWLVATLVALAWTVFGGGYFVLFWSTGGQTPGMRLLGVRVTHAGAAPGLGRSIVRLAGLLLAIVPFFAGFLPVLVDKRRRGLPDYLAGTVVVRAEPLA